MNPREPNLNDRYQRPCGAPAPAPTKPVGAFDAAPRSKPRRPRKGAGSRPNAAVVALYRERLTALVEDMHKSVLWWMRASYRENPPIMAQDHVERHIDDSGSGRHDIGHSENGVHAKAMTLLAEARRYDHMGYSFGLRGVRISPDRSKWHSYFDPSRDEVTTEEKFWREPSAERLHMMLHEIGHRGQGVDRSGYEKFKRLHLNRLPLFEAMANPVHLRDEREGHLHDIAEEVWAESYARWCLGLPMPDELREFWDERGRLGGHQRIPDRIRHEGIGGTVVDEASNVFGLDGTASSDAKTLREFRDERNVGRGGNGRPIYGSDSRLGSTDMAMDRTPADHLRSAFARLRKRWEDRFDEAAAKLARWFAQSAATRSDERLRRILKDGGLSVRFTPTKAMRDVQAATVQANVALIKSIPSQYLTQVEGIVARSVQTGRDLHQLSNDLRHELGVTKRKAAFIALDQNQKATSAMTRARQMELGLQAIWKHSHAGKTPRPSHVANDGKPYDPVRGWWDPHEKKFIWPGTLISCRCYSQTVVPSFKP